MDSRIDFFCILSVLALLLTSCSDILPERVKPVGEHEVRVEFSACLSQHDTKAAIDEIMIRNVIVGIYDRTGMLYRKLSLSGTEPGYIKLISGITYRVYAVANIDGFTFPDVESDLNDLRYVTKLGTDFSAEGFPMACITEVKVNGSNSKVSLLMERMVAKISFSVESSSLPGFKVESVRLMNNPRNMLIFKQNSKSTLCTEGGYVSAEDITAVNSGGSAVFYMLENCQGVLLPNNDDPWKKVLDNLPAAVAGKCSYLEVKASLDGTSGVEGPVIYRFYLGQDMVSDFNIYRNTSSKVTLTVTEGGLEKVSWRIDSSNLKPLPVPIITVGSSGLICHTDRNGSIHRQKVGTVVWNDVISAGDKYIAVGKDGYVAVSTDGESWKMQDLGDADWSSVTYGNGVYVAVGTYARPVQGSQSQSRFFGYVATSADAENWSQTKLDDNCLFDVAYMNGIFMISSEFREWYSYVSKWILHLSKDTKTWENIHSGSRIYRKLLAGDNEFIACDAGNYVYSGDGYSWSDNVFGGVSNVADLVWDMKRKYVAAGVFGDVGYSADCRNWNKSSVPQKRNWRAVSYGADRFIAVGDAGAAIYSSDGRVWYELDLGVTNDLYGVCVMRQ